MQGVLVQSLVRKTISHIPYAAGQISLCVETSEPVCHNKISHVPQLKPDAAKYTHTHTHTHTHTYNPYEYTSSPQCVSIWPIHGGVIQEGNQIALSCQIHYQLSCHDLLFPHRGIFFLVSHSAILNSVCPWFSWYLLICSSLSLDNHSVSLDFSSSMFP